MAQDNLARLLGQRVALVGREGPFRVCPTCRSCEGRIEKGSGPHVASLVCTGCTSHISWLSRAHVDAFAARAGRAA